jgi:hypothetical protein
MPRRFRTAAAIATAGALALLGTGCGNKHHTITEAKTEGIWVDVGALNYQVQGSRQVTPAMVPDNSYLLGLPVGILPASATETWFAVFMRIENHSGKAHPTAREFEIVDTEDRVFKPLELDVKSNPFAYQPQVLQADHRIPRPDSAQDFDSAAGALLLFKLPLDSYQNRPLELRIKSADVAPREATIDLDV